MDAHPLFATELRRDPFPNLRYFVETWLQGAEGTLHGWDGAPTVDWTRDVLRETDFRAASAVQRGPLAGAAFARVDERARALLARARELLGEPQPGPPVLTPAEFQQNPIRALHLLQERCEDVVRLVNVVRERDLPVLDEEPEQEDPLAQQLALCMRHLRELNDRVSLLAAEQRFSQKKELPRWALDSDANMLKACHLFAQSSGFVTGFPAFEVVQRESMGFRRLHAGVWVLGERLARVASIPCGVDPWVDKNDISARWALAQQHVAFTGAAFPLCTEPQPNRLSNNDVPAFELQRREYRIAIVPPHVERNALEGVIQRIRVPWEGVPPIQPGAWRTWVAESRRRLADAFALTVENACIIPTLQMENGAHVVYVLRDQAGLRVNHQLNFVWVPVQDVAYREEDAACDDEAQTSTRLSAAPGNAHWWEVPHPVRPFRVTVSRGRRVEFPPPPADQGGDERITVLLNEGEYLESPSGRVRLLVSADGALVLYRPQQQGGEVVLNNFHQRVTRMPPFQLVVRDVRRGERRLELHSKRSILFGVRVNDANALEVNDHGGLGLPPLNAHELDLYHV